MEVTMVAAQCRESWPQISEPGGRVLDRTRERAWGRWGGKKRRCRQGQSLGEGERQMDRSVVGWGGGSRLSTGEELCFRSSLPEICFHHADTGREKGGRKRERERQATQRYILQECQGVWERVEESTINRKTPKVMIFCGF